MKLNLFLLLVILSSCASHKVLDRNAVSSDSLRQTTRLSIRQISVPESRADLQIPVAGLRELPPAAVYTAKSGQATAVVRFIHDTLFVSASCDSLQQLVYDYQQQIEKMSYFVQNSQKKTEQKRKFSRWLLLGCCLCLLLSSVLSKSRHARRLPRYL